MVEGITVAEPAVYDWKVVRGDTFTDTVIYKDENDQPIDLTGYTARMHVRLSDRSPIVLALTTGNGGITISGPQGEIALEGAAVDMVFGPGCYKYDLEITSPSGVVTTILTGKFEVEADITR